MRLPNHALFIQAFTISQLFNASSVLAADNQGVDGIAGAIAAGHGNGVAISVGTLNAAGSSISVNSSRAGDGGVTQSVGNISTPQSASTSLSTSNILPLSVGAAVSSSISAAASVTTVGPGNVAIGGGGGFGIGITAAVDNAAGAGVPPSNAAGNGNGFASADASGPLTASSQGNGNGNAAANPSGIDASVATSASTASNVSSAGTGSVDRAGFSNDPTLPTDVSVSLDIANSGNSIATAGTGEFGAFFVGGAVAGNTSANLTLGGNAVSIITGGANAPGVFTAITGSGAVDVDFALNGVNSNIETSGNMASGVQVFAAGGGVAEVDVFLNGAMSAINTGGNNSFGTFLFANGQDDSLTSLSLGGAGSAISTAGDFSYGTFLFNQSGSNAVVNLSLDGASSSISTVGNDAFGAYGFVQGAINTTANLQLAGANSAITTVGDNATGAYLAGVGTGATGNTDTIASISGKGGRITTAGSDSIGVFATALAPEIANVRFSLSGEESAVSTLGASAYGVFLGSFGPTALASLVMSGEESSILTEGDSALGIFAFSGGGTQSDTNVTLSGKKSRISTRGAGSFGAAILGTGTLANKATLDLSGAESTIVTGGDGAIGAFLIAGGAFDSATKVTLSGANSRISTSGNQAFGVYVAGSGGNANLIVELSGADSAVVTSGGDASAVIIAGPNGKVSLSGDRSNISTSGSTAAGVVVEGDNGEITLARNTTIMTTGINAPAIYFQPWTDNQRIENAGALLSAQSTAVIGSDGNDTFINSGTVAGGAGNAIELKNGADNLVLRAGSRIAGAIDLGVGANSVVISAGNDAAMVWSFDGNLATANINVEGGVPFVILRPGIGGSTVSVATVDPTGFAAVNNGVTSLASGITGLVGQQLKIAELAGYWPSTTLEVGSTRNPIPNNVVGATTNETQPDSVTRSEIDSNYDAARFWASTFSGAQKQFENRSTLESTNFGGGLAIGVDTMLTPDFRGGFFAGSFLGRAAIGNNVQTINSSGLFAGVYGSYYSDSALVDAIFTGGIMQYDSKRMIINNLTSTGMETASAAYDGWFVSSQLSASKEYDYFDQTILTTTARLRHVIMGFEGYSESGSLAGLDVASRVTQTLEGRLEISTVKQLETSPGHNLRTMTNIGLFGRFGIGNSSVDTTLLGQNLAFSSPDNSPEFGVYAGGSLEYHISDNATLTGAIEATIDSSISIGFQAKAGLRFVF